jgi:AraC-like DNA-binding protein
MAMLISRLKTECQRLDTFAATARKNLLELLMFPIARSSRTEETLRRPASHQVQDSMRYLFRHFREDVTLAELAEKSGYSPNYFSHLFHESCGIRFVDFLTQLRLNYARTMLLTSSLPVSQIAQVSGFSSQSNFFRAFRKQTGLSPLEYRARYQPEGGNL